MNDWARLYQAAIRIKETAPWAWLDEGQIFGVQDPDTGEIGFVSVMGSMGERYALASYVGAKGLYGFRLLEQMGPDGDAEMVFEIPQLQISFEDRDVLTAKDRDIIKQLGLRFRGRQEWPMFRSYRPGYFPWYLEPDEVRAFTCVLEQALEVSARAKENPTIFDVGDETTYLVRVQRARGSAAVWEDQVISVTPPEPETVSVSMDLEALRLLKSLPRSQVVLEADLSLFPGHFGEKGERPQCAYLLMLVDSDSGFVFAGELLSPEPTFGAMCGTIPNTAVCILAEHGILPREIRVRSRALLPWLQLVGDDLGCKVPLRSRLPSLDKAVNFLTARM